MNKVDLIGLINATNQLFGHWGFCELRRQRDGGGAKMSPEFSAELKQTLITIHRLCERMGFSAASAKVKSSLSHLDRAVILDDASSIGTELRNIIESVAMDGSKFIFLGVSPDRSAYIDNGTILGTQVAQAFPSAVPDIREAGNCLGSECNTAAVFHLMRVVEWGLRALCADLGLIRLKSKTRGGKTKYTPMAYSDWEHMLGQLNTKVDSKISKMGKGKRKQQAQEFYYPILQDIRGIRDAWRNHIMHTRAEYNRRDADAISEHVRRTMVSLSKRVSEV